MAEILPEGVWFTEIAVTELHWLIKGHGMTLADIENFAVRIAAEQQIAVFQLKELSRDNDNYRFVLRFSLLAIDPVMEGGGC